VTEYAGRQFVGIDLHRRRSVIARTTGDGELLQALQIVNDVESLNAVVALAGEDPEVVLEATYGWDWAVDALQAAGARVHLAHPFGGEGVRVPAGEERSARRGGSGRPAADGPAGGGVDRTAGDAGGCRHRMPPGCSRCAG